MNDTILLDTVTRTFLEPLDFKVTLREIRGATRLILEQPTDRVEPEEDDCIILDKDTALQLIDALNSYISRL